MLRTFKKNDKFAFKGDKSRVVRRTFWLMKVVRRTLWLIKVVPTWKKFEKRWFKGPLLIFKCLCRQHSSGLRLTCCSQATGDWPYSEALMSHTLSGGHQVHWINQCRSAYRSLRLDAGKKSLILSVWVTELPPGSICARTTKKSCPMESSKYIFVYYKMFMFIRSLLKIITER
jgi:hypothetical protein